MKPPAVYIDVSRALLRQYLSGFRGYPNTPAGETRFAEAVQDNAISVEHAENFLKSFDGVFPTVREICDTAFASRAKFEPDPLIEKRKQWERECGKPHAFNLYPPDRIAMHWQAFRDTLYYTEGPGAGPKISSFWQAAAQEDLKIHLDSVLFVREQVSRYGWPAVKAMVSAPEGMPYKNPLGNRPVTFAHATDPKRITQKDFDALMVPKALPAPTGDTGEVWDDPDR